MLADSSKIGKTALTRHGFLHEVVVPLVVVLVIAIKAQKYVTGIADFLSAGRVAGRYVVAVAGVEAGMGLISLITIFEMYYNAGFAVSFWGSIAEAVSRKPERAWKYFQRILPTTLGSNDPTLYRNESYGRPVAICLQKRESYARWQNNITLELEGRWYCQKLYEKDISAHRADATTGCNIRQACIGCYKA